MMRAGLESKDPSGAATLEGSNAKALRAIASPAEYTMPAGASKFQSTAIYADTLHGASC